MFLTIVLMLALFACTDNYQEMNTSPNDLTQVPYKSLVSHAQNSILRDYNPILGGGVAGWARYNVRDVYVHGDRYSGDGSGTNFNQYSGHLKDLQVAIKLATAANDANWVAIAKIMTAYAFQNITDWYGDIPYSEALMADDPENPNIFPKYDSQKSIYTDLIVQLKAANAMIDTNKSAGSADIMFNGDMMKWKRFANSLLLRVYMRMSRVEPATAKAGIEEIAGNSSTYPVINSVTNAALKYWLPGDATYRSPYYMIPGQNAIQETATSVFIVNFMKEMIWPDWLFTQNLPPTAGSMLVFHLVHLA